ncbi:TlpA family protein disulfide reductase [Riemerella columbipharyngis]|uniref:Thiol-disulfide isomerase or thioredoxin n=1 Tax=Riemerella columbipharyngis TaxID=1071918 RepID=A0A1G7D004_9FLAO|nr:TlpA disulfide reductase family protein [Riemerella columbipharyngis]SDE44055.1 Thiol-disulfide isomerase or thioredoxin [Riemerella columbipharyngis]
MKFFKKRIIDFVLLGLLLVFLFVPKVRDFISGKLLFFGPDMSEVTKDIALSDSEYDVELEGINVPNANLKDFKGKLLFLNFWGTWCPPCRAEWGSIQKLYDQEKDKMQFVLVAMQDQRKDVEAFLKENNYTAPVYLAVSPLSDKILPQVFPSTFIIDKKGRVLKKDEGANNWSSEAVISFIDNVSK